MAHMLLNPSNGRPDQQQWSHPVSVFISKTMWCTAWVVKTSYTFSVNQWVGCGSQVDFPNRNFDLSIICLLQSARYRVFVFRSSLHHSPIVKHYAAASRTTTGQNRALSETIASFPVPLSGGHCLEPKKWPLWILGHTTPFQRRGRLNLGGSAVLFVCFSLYPHPLQICRGILESLCPSFHLFVFSSVCVSDRVCSISP